LDLLLRRPNVDVNARDSFGDTPLHEAIVKEDAAVLSLLCSCPDVDFTICNQVPILPKVTNIGLQMYVNM
jgi:ankyrin repeat protein